MVNINHTDDWRPIDLDDPEISDEEYQRYFQSGQVKACYQSADDGRLLSLESGTGAHSSGKYQIVIVNAPFWEDQHVLETVDDTDSLDEAESIMEDYMENNK